MIAELKWKVMWQLERRLYDPVAECIFALRAMFWALKHPSRPLAGQGAELPAPARIECSTPLESWMVQKKLAKIGTGWTDHEPWAFRHRMWLVVGRCVRGENIGKPYVAWTSHAEFEELDMPMFTAEDVLRSYSKIERAEGFGADENQAAAH